MRAMKYRWLLILAAVSVGASCASAVVRSRTNNVDTRIGSGGFGFGIGEINPGPSMPFGCMRLGPDTSVGLEPIRIPFQTYAGYAYDTDYIECFSHTHVVGAGLGDFQNFGVTVIRKWNNDVTQAAGYRSLYTHTQEVALPGYYAVDLLTHNTYAELTVSGTHSGMHRYTCRSQWPSSDAAPCNLVIDICHGFPKSFSDGGNQCKEAQVMNVTSDDGGFTYRVDAFILMAGDFSAGGPLGGLQIYFHAIITAQELNDGTGSPVRLFPATWVDGAITETLYHNLTTSGSLGLGLLASTDANGTVQFTVRAGISFVSSENARTNLEQQQRISSAWMTFDESVQVAVDSWEAILSSVSYSGGVGENQWHRTVFDSTMYRAHLPPSTYSEANGQYLGQDMLVHTVNVSARERHLSDLSIWDIYRTQTPMLLWTKPDVALDLTNSMLVSYNYTHQLPKWLFANIETGCMVGLHSAAIFADYASKGLGGVDEAFILDVIASGVAPQNSELEPYGYVTVEASSEGASNTQDYAVDAGAVAYLASFLGNTTTYAAFETYSKMYRNVFDNASTFFCPRASNGTFSCPDLTLTYPFEHSYTEGDAWQYRWYVPHDVRGLLALFSNPATFVDSLYEFFNESYQWPLNNTLPNPYFWAGNEPDIQTPMLFNWAGNEFAYLTSEVFPQLLDYYYIPYASGVPGDDDYGAMSAWCFWGYTGLFPMVPSAEYALFAPRFDVINVTLDAFEMQVSPWRNVQRQSGGGRTTVVQVFCYNRPPAGSIAYVANISLNGQLLDQPIVTHDQLLASPRLHGSPTVLEFYLTSEPTVFGSQSPSAGGPDVYVPQRKKEASARSTQTTHASVSDVQNAVAAARMQKLKRHG